MKAFLKKIRLIDNLQIELEIGRQEFVDRLYNNIYPGDIGMFSSPFEAFRSGNHELKGQVDYEGFKLKRRRRLFDTNMNLAIASGTFSEFNGRLQIDTEINGFPKIMILFYILIPVLYAVIFISSGFASGETPFPVFPFLLLHGVFMLGAPYLMMRRSVKRMKYELEREFYYLTKK